MIGSMKTCRNLLRVAALVLVPAATALAQNMPEKPGPPPTGKWLMAYLFMAIGFGALCMGAFKSSGRTHQD